jgi:diguanylate cyclase (GGDEF)-like protein
MQLERFKHFCHALQDDADTSDLITSIEVFRLFDSSWFDENDQTVEDPELVSNLEYTLEYDTVYREVKSTTAYIAVPECAAVARAEFASPPRRPSMLRVSEQIDACRINAGHAYDAMHDAMTGLLNSKGFSEAIESVAMDLDAEVELPATAAVTAEASTLGLLALDIDYFKQVNDSFGHMYGDLVIKALAMRLRDAAHALVEAAEESLTIEVARPSGEEFLILMSGEFDLQAFQSFAEHFRQAVCARPLPDETEWEILATSELKTTPPPPPTSRNVTVSIGASSMATPLRADALRSADILRSHADLALYSAKSGGRNVVRHFTDILQKYGHVLEHHLETGIVAIDLGRNVNVALGQEFHVFHPKFDGTTPFTRTDGRTTKKLGLYPRQSIGRIVVVDVQQDISFCKISSDPDSIFPEGSHLEAIPVGSITHLITSPSLGGLQTGLDLAPPEQLAARIKAAGSSETFPVVAVFVLSNVDDLLNARGTAFVNEALARLFAAMKEVLPSATLFGQLHSTELAAIATMKPEGALEVAKNVIGHAASQCYGLGKFAAGLFIDSPEEQTEESNETSKIDREYALDCARFAATFASDTVDAATIFSREIAEKLMRTTYENRLYRKGIEDYRTFVKMGIQDMAVENLGALCAFSLDDNSETDLMFEAGERALKLSPGNDVLARNLAVFHHDVGNYSEAHTYFELASQLVPVEDIAPSIIRVRALCYYMAYESGKAVDRDKVLELLSSVPSIRPSYGIDHADIENAIAMMKKEQDNS